MSETTDNSRALGCGAIVRRLRFALAIQRRNRWCMIGWRWWLFWRCLTMSTRDLMWCEHFEREEVKRDAKANAAITDTPEETSRKETK